MNIWQILTKETPYDIIFLYLIFRKDHDFMKKLVSVLLLGAMMLSMLASCGFELPQMPELDLDAYPQDAIAQGVAWDGSASDTTWYTNDPSAKTFSISTGAELKGFIDLVYAAEGAIDFEGKTVAFETGSAADSLVTGEIEGLNVNDKGVTSQMDAIREVNMGTADYAVVDVLLAEEICGKGDYANLDINEGIEIGIEYYAIGFKKGSELTEKVNIMLQAFEITGQLEDLAEKYGLENSLILLPSAE